MDTRLASKVAPLVRITHWFLVSPEQGSAMRIVDGLVLVMDDRGDLVAANGHSERAVLRFHVDDDVVWLYVCHSEWRLSANGVPIRGPRLVRQPTRLRFGNWSACLAHDLSNSDDDVRGELQLERDEADSTKMLFQLVEEPDPCRAEPGWMPELKDVALESVINPFETNEHTLSLLVQEAIEDDQPPEQMRVSPRIVTPVRRAAIVESQVQALSRRGRSTRRNRAEGHLGLELLLFVGCLLGSVSAESPVRTLSAHEIAILQSHQSTAALSTAALVEAIGELVDEKGADDPAVREFVNTAYDALGLNREMPYRIAPAELHSGVDREQLPDQQ